MKISIILASIFHKYKRLANNLIKDMKYGKRFLGGGMSSRYNDHSYNMANTDYNVLPVLFNKANVKKSDVVVEVGCGKGRVINWLLSNGFRNNIYGIEIDKEICRNIKKRLKNYKNVHILEGSAESNIPEDSDVFYLYNPFDKFILTKFLNKLIDMFYNKKDITIIYYNPFHLEKIKNFNKFNIEYFNIKDYFKKSESFNMHDFAVIKFKKNLLKSKIISPKNL